MNSMVASVERSREVKAQGAERRALWPRRNPQKGKGADRIDLKEKTKYNPSKKD